MLERQNYTAHEALVRAARAKPQLWRLGIGLVVVYLIAFALSSVVLPILAALFPGTWLSGMADGSTPGAMLVLLGGFGFITLGVALSARLLQDRAFFSVIGQPRPLVRQFLRVSLYLLGLGIVLSLLPPYEMGAPMQPNLPFGTWLSLLPFSLLVVLIQTSAEEILFRGYIQQSLAARFKSPLIWLVAPSAVFALGHFLPNEAGDNAVLIALWAGVFGCLMADLTARAGTLGPAIAVHFFNNVTALLLFASPSSLHGLALYLQPFDMSDTEALRPWLAVDFAMMLVTWLAARLAIRR
ncbi:CPBP family intramembrane glutamic endopeptidase [Phycobacter azelaicus]|jgi:membrane protease YdiL (CAAX protease family)|uniref:CPBP family intramembrane glutamic endopeptidase n=1 Tax=Phycobacter azelaicus TaxID=2668075 RepID=UPI0018693D9B|nr:type II CAAX endopeptidase family protein [Phycobacter azelaicus]MBE1297879.1 CPBP family intramembrane metalloprotease [Paracoccaceae bacterium]